jgi:hypothetical protein
MCISPARALAQSRWLTRHQIGDLKSKINAEKGWDVAKLIYSGMSTLRSSQPRHGYLQTLIGEIGKILQDANTIESYSIEEKDFIVCMVSRVCATVTPLDCVLANHLRSHQRRPLPRQVKPPPRHRLPPPLRLLLLLLHPHHRQLPRLLRVHRHLLPLNKVPIRDASMIRRL